jgi:hypothetical protein
MSPSPIEPGGVAMPHNAPMSIAPRRRLPWRRIVAAGVVVVVVVVGARYLTTQADTLERL